MDGWAQMALEWGGKVSGVSGQHFGGDLRALGRGGSLEGRAQAVL